MILQDFLNALKNYTNFSGRARRREFWAFSIGAALISAVVALIAIVLTGGYGQVDRTPWGISYHALGVIVAAIVIFICPVLSVTVRRLHDTGHSALWIAFLVAFYVAMFFSSVIGDYGDGTGIFTALSFALGFVTFILFVTNFILLFCADSQKGENQYGPNPKE